MTTRSGAIYNRANTAKPICTVYTNTDTELIRSVSEKRNTRTSFSLEFMREYCGDSDNDSTSTYDSEEEEHKTEKAQSYSEKRLQSIAPKYEVHIDFNEASVAWRANKRRVGESWKYIKPKVNAKPKSLTMVTRSSNRRR